MAAGSACRRLSAIVPAVSHGRWGSQATAGRHSSGLPWPATRIVPSVGVSSPAMAASRVDLPQPDGPTTAVNPMPNRVGQARHDGGTTPAEGDGVEHDAGFVRDPVAAGAGASSRARSTDANAAAPSAAAWNSAPTRRIGQ